MSGPGVWARVSGPWAYWLWLSLEPIWLAFALWDLIRRQGSRAVHVAWALLAIGLPYLGPAAYLLRPPPFRSGEARTLEVDFWISEQPVEVAFDTRFSAWTYNRTGTRPAHHRGRPARHLFP